MSLGCRVAAEHRVVLDRLAARNREPRVERRPPRELGDAPPRERDVDRPRDPDRLRDPDQPRGPDRLRVPDRPRETDRPRNADRPSPPRRDGRGQQDEPAGRRRHLEQAIDHLHAAGLHDLAEQVRGNRLLRGPVHGSGECHAQRTPDQARLAQPIRGSSI